MPETPTARFGYAPPSDTDFINDWPQIERAALALIESKGAIFTHADPRPAAGVAGRFHRHPTTGVISYDTGSAWIQISPVPKVFQTVSNLLVAGLVSVPSGAVDVIPPVFVSLAAGQTAKLVKVLAATTVAVANFKVQRNGVDVTGATACVAAYDSDHSYTVDQTLAQGDKLQVIVTSTAPVGGNDPQNLTVGLVLEHTV